MKIVRAIFGWMKENISTILMGVSVAAIIALLGIFFLIRGRDLMQTELRDRLSTLSATAALIFKPSDLNQLRGDADVKKPLYMRIIQELNVIRTQNADVHFIYILRPTSDPKTFEFVADADSLHPFAPYYDLNHDGVIDDSDTLAPPGTPYDVTDIPEIQDALTHTVTLKQPYSDQWGSYISSFSPIMGPRGKAVAVLGVDVDIGHFTDLSQRIFSPITYLFVVLVGIAISLYIVFSAWRHRVSFLQSLSTERSGLLRLTFHRLGQPLTILRWSIESIRDSRKIRTDRTLQSQVDDLDNAAERIDAILTELHAADQVYSGSLRYKPTQINVSRVVRSVIRSYDARIRAMKQRIKIVVAPSLTVFTDGKLLTDVLFTLLENAIDYSPERATITITAQPRKNDVLFSVMDHGKGIPAKDQSRLFHEFVRASNAAIMKPDGSGLGLYIAKGIVDRFGGTMWLKSKEGKGTTIFFTVPMHS
jgi:signal transduction histidine kinase